MKTFSKNLTAMFFGVFLLFALSGCAYAMAPTKPLPEQPPAVSNDKAPVEYYDIYLSRRIFDQVDLIKLIEMEDETPSYVITCKSYEINLEKSILTVNGVMVVANTDSRILGKNGQDLAPIKMWADKIQINLSLASGWYTCVVVEKSDKQYFISAYGRVHKLGAPYELVLPKTKIN